MSLLVLGVNHRTAPVQIREQLTIDSEALPGALDELAQRVAPGVILSTCNRLEIYTLNRTATETEDPAARLREFISWHSGVPLDGLTPYCYQHVDEGCVQHLFQVASGLDSMVVGEWEILGQIRAAFSAASATGSQGSYVKGPLSRLFHQALRVGRRVHHDSNLSGGRRRSVSQVGVRMANRLLGGLSERQVLLVGAGNAGQLAGRALAEAGAGNVVVTNRTYSRAEELSGQLGGVAAPFEQLLSVLADSDAAICTTASPNYVLGHDQVRQVMERRGGRPLLLIDIAVPRDVDPMVGLLDGVRLCDIDDLRADSVNDGAAEPEAIQAEVLVAEETARFMEWWGSLDTITAVATLREYAEEIRRAEVERTLARLKNRRSTGEGNDDVLDLEDLAGHLDAMTSALVKKLMHHPTMYLKQGNDPARQEVFREMYRMDSSGERHGRR